MSGVGARGRTLLAGALALLATGLVACHSDAEIEACTKACERPFELVRRSATPRSSSWKQLPEPLRKEAATLVLVWQQRHNAARQEWSEACVPRCLDAYEERDVRCRAGANDIGTWKRCGGKR